MKIFASALVALAIGLAAALPAAAQEMMAKDAVATAKAVKSASPGQVAARERMKTCSTEWKQTKADGKVESGMKWPKFWSACNARLKGKAG